MDLQWTPEMVADVISHPARINATPALAAWVQSHGGIGAVYRLLHDIPLSPDLLALLEALLAIPGATVAELCVNLAIGRSTFHRYKQQLLQTLTVFLNQSGRVSNAQPDIRSPLPHPTTSFVGRETERQTLQALVSDPARRLITLTGTGGTGKTRLAIHVGADVRPWFPDGIIFLPLADLLDSTMVIPTIAAAFRIDAPAAVLHARLARVLESQRCLVILDNLEHVIDAAPDIAALLGATSQVTILATSRRPLRISGEYVYPVQPLPIGNRSTSVSPRDRAMNPAIQLFVQRAQAVNPDFTVTQETLAVIHQVCDHLDGLPLAIELAAARSTILSPRLLLAQLQDRMSFLVDGPRDMPRRQQTIQATLEWGYRLLSPSERQCLGSLSVFAGSIGFDTMLSFHAHTATGAGATGSALTMLGQLVEQSWLQRHVTESGEIRFTMLHVIREFLRGLHADEADWEAWFQQYYEEIQHVVIQGGAAYRTPDEQRWFTRLEEELPNIRDLLGWHLTHPTAHGAGGPWMYALLGFWWSRGLRAEGLQWFQQALTCLPPKQHETIVHAQICYGIGKLEPRSEASIQALTTSLTIHRRIGPSVAFLDALNWLAYMEGARGAMDGAITLYEEALSLIPTYGDDRFHAAVLHNMGLIFAELQHDFPKAITYFQNAYALAQRLGLPEFLTLIERSLGSALAASGAVHEGIAYLEQAIRRAREIPLLHYLPTLVNTLALCYEQEGRFTECYALLREGITIQQHMADIEYISWTLYLLAKLYARVQHWDIAATMLGAAESMFGLLNRMLEPLYQEMRQTLSQELKRALGEAAWEWAFHRWDGWDAMTIRAAVLALDPP